MKKATAEFYGLTGDPAQDERTKRRIMRELGPDNFDENPWFDNREAGREYEEYKSEEVRSLNAR